MLRLKECMEEVRELNMIKEYFVSKVSKDKEKKLVLEMEIKDAT